MCITAAPIEPKHLETAKWGVFSHAHFLSPTYPIMSPAFNLSSQFLGVAHQVCIVIEYRPTYRFLSLFHLGA